MSIFSKVDGAWMPIRIPRVHTGIEWVQCKVVYTHMDGEWHRVYQRSADIIEFPQRTSGLGGLQDVCVSAA